jgi:signal transduction histidine kinase
MGADDLPHTLSHDLRGPLMAISGAAELICAIAASGDPDRQIRGWCHQIHHATSVMERLIHDLLERGSFEDAQLRLRPAPHDVAVLMRGAVDAFQKAASAKNIFLATDFPAEPVTAECDRGRIVQVISNILRNAIAFTPQGGSIHVRATRRNDEVTISVADTGAGIPKAEQNAIFERFRQVREEERTGAGLGLYIAQWIVDAHGGRIWVESNVGRGSTFSFTLHCERSELLTASAMVGVDRLDAR